MCRSGRDEKADKMVETVKKRIESYKEMGRIPSLVLFSPVDLAHLTKGFYSRGFEVDWSWTKELTVEANPFVPKGNIVVWGPKRSKQ